MFEERVDRRKSDTAVFAQRPPTYHAPMPTRRDFLTSAAAVPWLARLDALPAELASVAQVQERWERVRAEFSIPQDRIYLNVGTLGPQPRVVVDAVIDHTRRVAESLPPAVQLDALKSEAARLLRCDPAGLVFPRNTTEGMNFVANGLELATGNEIVTTRHEHIGGLCCWELVAKRRGLGLNQVVLPDPTSAQSAFDAIVRAITPRTRVVSVSHVNFTNGLVMPVRPLIEHCRPRGIIVVVDGAHPPGLMPVDLGAMDPDFYATSPHKWLFAAQGTGLLYLRDEWRTKLWPTIASGEWDDTSLGAQRLNHLGTVDESRLAGLLAALRFHQAIGPESVYARIRELRGYLFQHLREDPRVRFQSLRDDAAFAGMVSFTVDGVSALQLQARLAERNVRTRVIGEYDLQWLRLSAAVYNTREQMERVAGMIREA
jgi:selenocysteine lyase/cysteine desulfurase